VRQFCGLFIEACLLTSPSLPRTDCVIIVSSKGFFLLNNTLNVLIAMHFYEVVDVFYQEYVSCVFVSMPYCPSYRSHRGKPSTFTLITVKGAEFLFASHNSETIAKILRIFLDGLRRRSRWGVGLQDFVMEGMLQFK
jgi:myosin-7